MRTSERLRAKRRATLNTHAPASAHDDKPRLSGLFAPELLLSLQWDVCVLILLNGARNDGQVLWSPSTRLECQRMDGDPLGMLRAVRRRVVDENDGRDNYDTEDRREAEPGRDTE